MVPALSLRRSPLGRHSKQLSSSTCKGAHLLKLAVAKGRPVHCTQLHSEQMGSSYSHEFSVSQNQRQTGMKMPELHKQRAGQMDGCPCSSHQHNQLIA